MAKTAARHMHLNNEREENQEIWEQQQKRTQVLTTVDILPRKRRNG